MVQPLCSYGVGDSENCEPVRSLDSHLLLL